MSLAAATERVLGHKEFTVRAGVVFLDATDRKVTKAIQSQIETMAATMVTDEDVVTEITSRKTVPDADPQIAVFLLRREIKGTISLEETAQLDKLEQDHRIDQAAKAIRADVASGAIKTLDEIKGDGRWPVAPVAR